MGSYFEKTPAFFYPAFGVIKSRAGVKKAAQNFVMENTHIGLKIAINYVYGHAYSFTENIFKFVQIIQEKYWVAFFYPNDRLFITPIKFKRTNWLFFTPRWSNLRGKKKRHFFITKISTEFCPFNMLNTCHLCV